MKLIVGLGNPGPAYRRTRHNLGFRVVDRLAEDVGSACERHEADALVGEASVEGIPLLLAKPQTYMNHSGRAVEALVRRYGVLPEDLLVILDDLALPLGTIRIRPRGSAGGHRGLHSVIEALSTEAFPRLRLGIRPLGASDIADVVAFVLSPFEPEEEPLVEEMIHRAVAAAKMWVCAGMEKTMAQFNVRPHRRAQEEIRLSQAECVSEPRGPT